MSMLMIGKKLGMTQLFVEKGDIVPVTVIQTGPCPVVQVKTAKRDNQDAVQLGFLDKKPKNVTKPLQGHFKKAGVTTKAFLKESKVEDAAQYNVGQIIDVSIFAKGDYVDVIGTSKGHGFAGTVRRYHFRGGKASHGATTHRAPGSIGSSAWPSRVFKGKRLPGHMGAARCTMQNLQVVEVRPEQNQLFVKGAVPGPTNGILYIRKAKKKANK